MRVRVRLFAGTRDAVGAGALDVELPEGARVADLFAHLVARHPRLAPYRSHALLAVDGAFVSESADLAAGAEVAIMPPVSGGCIALARSSPANTRTHEHPGEVFSVAFACSRVRGSVSRRATEAT